MGSWSSQRHVRWVAVLLMACVGGSHSQAGVLCIGEDGHAEVEFIQVGTGCGGGPVGTTDAGVSEAPSCGACVDLPLPFGQGAGDVPGPEVRGQVAALVLGETLVVGVTQGELGGSIWPVARVGESPGLSFLSTVVLLS